MTRSRLRARSASPCARSTAASRSSASSSPSWPSRSAISDNARTECSSFVGCNFSISKPALPLALNLLSTTAVSSRESISARWILVADGDEAAANRVAGFLLHARFRAYPAARGLDALRLAQRHRLGLAVVDVDLLDMAGCDPGRQRKAIEAALPLAQVLADPAAEHEERVAQAVQIAKRPLADWLDARQREQLALGAAAHGARLVEEPVDPAATRQDERLERRQIFLTPIHEGLELLHLAFADSEHALVDGVGRRRQLAAEVEELVLDLSQDFVEPAVPFALGEPLGVEDPHEPDDGVQLVDRAVGDDARRVLRDALAADQGGLALVAGARVDARDADRHGRLPSA